MARLRRAYLFLTHSLSHSLGIEIVLSLLYLDKTLDTII